MKPLLKRSPPNFVGNTSDGKMPGYGLAVLVVLLLSACSSGTQTTQELATQQKITKAKAIMEAASGSNVTGEAVFTEEDGKIRFEISLNNISPGVHAVHIHEKADCSAEGASSAGGHWNPTMKSHGKRGSGAHHKGDIDNIQVDNTGQVTFSVVVEGWTIGGPDNTNVVGKSVIVHEKADDFTSQPAGNAGSRISCGVIKQD